MGSRPDSRATRQWHATLRLESRRSGATDNRSAPASVSPPPSPPWNAGREPSEPLADRHASRRALICQTFGLCKSQESPVDAKRLASAPAVSWATRRGLHAKQSSSQAVNVGRGAGAVGTQGRGGMGGRDAHRGRTVVTLEDV